MFSEPPKSKNGLITLLLNLSNLFSNVVKQRKECECLKKKKDRYSNQKVFLSLILYMSFHGKHGVFFDL